MELELSSAQANRLDWRESTGSTNADLLALAGQANLPDFTVLATANQQAGRGRAGREWVTAPDTALAVSVLLKPPMLALQTVDLLGWLPLLAGLAVTEAVNQVLADSTPAVPVRATIKWPNDVLVSGRKVCGVLSELLPGFDGVVVGAGINLTQSREQLPISAATSLQLSGATLPADLESRLDLVLSTYLGRLRHWYDRFAEHGLNADSSGLRAAVVSHCSTIGQPVRAILPDHSELIGTATGIDATGRLAIDVAGKSISVSAGDIVHLRPAASEG